MKYARHLTDNALAQYRFRDVDICLLYPYVPPECEEGGCNETPCAHKFFKNNKECPRGDKYDLHHYVAKELDYYRPE